MSKSLAIYRDFNTLQRAAMALQKSGYFQDAKSEAQAIVKVMAGTELGIPPFAAMSGIHIVKGKPVLGANLIATLVKNDPRYNYSVKTATDTECNIEWFEEGKSCGQSSFTMDEAKRAGLAGRDNWKNFPSDMLFARALTRGARRYAPGIFGGAPIYTPEELGADTDEEGYVVTETTIVDPDLSSSVKQQQPEDVETPDDEAGTVSGNVWAEKGNAELLDRIRQIMPVDDNTAKQILLSPKPASTKWSLAGKYLIWVAGADDQEAIHLLQKVSKGRGKDDFISLLEEYKALDPKDATDIKMIDRIYKNIKKELREWLNKQEGRDDDAVETETIETAEGALPF